MHGGFKEGARTALSACWSAPFSETRGQGCPRSFRALLESAVGEMSQNVTRKGGFNKRSRRREEADFCNKSSSASSRRRLQRSGRFLNPALRRPAEGRFALTLTMGRIASPLDDNTDAHQPIQAHAQSFPSANWSLEQA